MKLVRDEFLHLILPDGDGDGRGSSPAAIRRLTDPRLDDVSVGLLEEVVVGLRMSGVRVEEVHGLGPDEVKVLAERAPAGAVERVTVARVVSRLGIPAKVFLTSTDSGALGGLRVLVDPPSIRTAEHLRGELRRLDPEASVLVARTGEDSDDGRTKAVASLVKIFVLLAVLEAADAGLLELEHQHIVRAQDITPLSAGLTSRHVGARLTIADLCRLMILRSDNSASDILLRAVGRDAVARVMERCGVAPDANRPLRSMRETIDAAWGPDAAAGADEHLRRAAISRPVHRRGLDFYAPLRAVAEALGRLARAEWTPWSEAAAPVLYKGGSAPGVLAAAWHAPAGEHPASLLFAVNADAPLGALEELYAFSCAEALLASLGVRVPGGGGTPYVESREG